MTRHRYLSTGCLHNQHRYCRSRVAHDVEGMPFVRRPSRCKFCSSPCICPCHRNEPTPQSRWRWPFGSWRTSR